MESIIEYKPEIPPTDITLTPSQNRSIFGVKFLDWMVDFTYHINIWRRMWERN